MTLSGDNMQAAKLDYFIVLFLPFLLPLLVFFLPFWSSGNPRVWALGFSAKYDVNAAPGHVGGNGNGTYAASLGDNSGLFFMLFGIEYLVGYASSFEQVAQKLGFLDGDGAYKHWRTLLVQIFNLPGNGFEFGVFVLVNLVGVVDANHRFVGGYNDHLKLVNFVKFLGFGGGGTGHAGQLLIKAEVVLEGDGGQSYALPLDFDPFLGFDGLVQPFGVSPAEHEPAR